MSITSIGGYLLVTALALAFAAILWMGTIELVDMVIP